MLDTRRASACSVLTTTGVRAFAAKLSLEALQVTSTCLTESHPFLQFGVRGVRISVGEQEPLPPAVVLLATIFTMFFPHGPSGAGRGFRSNPAGRQTFSTRRLASRVGWLAASCATRLIKAIASYAVPLQASSQHMLACATASARCVSSGEPLQADKNGAICLPSGLDLDVHQYMLTKDSVTWIAFAC